MRDNKKTDITDTRILFFLSVMFRAVLYSSRTLLQELFDHLSQDQVSAKSESHLIGFKAPWSA